LSKQTAIYLSNITQKNRKRRLPVLFSALVDYLTKEIVEVTSGRPPSALSRILRANAVRPYKLF
jgi:hypothetical protein